MDGTLAVSKGPITETMAAVLNRLLAVKRVAVISGGRFEQFKTQLIDHLDPGNFAHLIIMPTTGAQMFQCKDESWVQTYDKSLTALERARITEALSSALITAGYQETETYGDIIEDRESQVTFSGLGSKAPASAKATWDPDMTKRTHIIEILKPTLSDFSISIGGMTSIDITKAGVDKAYAVKRLSEVLQIPLEKMLFIGDKLEPGGNDFPVKSTGIQTVAVIDPLETETLIQSFLA
jgi:HAD superfamily hydrolase (TIGR01484 family)